MNLISQSEYARILNVSRECINDKIKRGLITPTLNGNKRMIDLDLYSPKDYIDKRIKELELEIDALKNKRDKIGIL